MTEEYLEKHDMERDLGTEVEPYTDEEIDQMYEGLKDLKEVVGAPIASTIVREHLAPIKFLWER